MAHQLLYKVIKPHHLFRGFYLDNLDFRLSFQWFISKLEHIFRLFSDYPASSLENSSWFADVFETSFIPLKTVTVVVTHKRFPRKWQSRSEVTLVWSWDSHQTVSTYTNTVCEGTVLISQTRCMQVQNVLGWKTQLQNKVTSLLLYHFRGNLLWVTATITVFYRVKLVSDTSANQLMFSRPPRG